MLLLCVRYYSARLSLITRPGLVLLLGQAYYYYSARLNVTALPGLMLLHGQAYYYYSARFIITRHVFTALACLYRTGLSLPHRRQCYRAGVNVTAQESMLPRSLCYRVLRCPLPHVHVSQHRMYPYTACTPVYTRCTR